jgi:hypothetical protein
LRLHLQDTYPSNTLKQLSAPGGLREAFSGSVRYVLKEGGKGSLELKCSCSGFKGTRVLSTVT